MLVSLEERPRVHLDLRYQGAENTGTLFGPVNAGCRWSFRLHPECATETRGACPSRRLAACDRRIEFKVLALRMWLARERGWWAAADRVLILSTWNA